MKKGLRFGFVFLVFFLIHSAWLVFAQQPLMQVVDKRPAAFDAGGG